MNEDRMLKWGWRNRIVWAVLKFLLIERSTPKIIAGPFRGMLYLNTSLHSAFFPKILGIYEMELGAILKTFRSLAFNKVINIGAGEGYYAVGLLYAQIVSRVIAFEADPRGAGMMSTLCNLNGVSENRLELRGSCTLQELRSAFNVDERVAVIIDAEGAEAILLDPAEAPELKNSWILVELHDHLVRGVTELLIERFRSTHSYQLITGLDRTGRYHLPGLAKWLPLYFRQYAATEFRPLDMKWLWLVPRAAARA